MKQTLIQSSFVVALVVVLLGVAAYMPYYNLKKLTDREAELKASIDNAQSIRTENEKLKKEAGTYRDHVALIEKIQKSKTNVYPIFKNLEKYMPQDVVIATLSYNAGTVNINANSKFYDSIDEFLANLHESKEFVKSSVTTIKKDEKTGECTFTLIIDLKGEVK